MCHVYVRGDGLTCILTGDHEYPHRVSHTLITKVRMDDKKYPITKMKFE